MKKNFFEEGKGMESMFENIGTIDEPEKPQKEAEMKANEPEEIETIKEDTNEQKTPKKTTKKGQEKDKEEEAKKKYQIFSEVNQFVCDYLQLKSIVTGQSKKEILNEMFSKEIKEKFLLNDNATEEEMQRAIDKRMKQIEQMKTIFK